MSAGQAKSGALIVVVGPSGAGKDSLINAARAHFRHDAGIGFVKRVITRPVDGETEDHHSVTVSEFVAMESAGMFAVWWRAHNLNYGIPIRTISDLEAGKTLIVNGSRQAIGNFADVFPTLAVIEVTARPDVIAERLRKRGRESEEEIQRRIARVTDGWQPDCPFVRVDNSTTLTVAQSAFVEAIESLTTGLEPSVRSA